MNLYATGQVADEMPRCWRCNRLLAEFVTRPWRIRCGRCKATTQDGVEVTSVFIPSKVVGSEERKHRASE